MISFMNDKTDTFSIHFILLFAALLSRLNILRSVTFTFQASYDEDETSREHKKLFHILLKTH
jgi:hypothetical protein